MYISFLLPPSCLQAEVFSCLFLYPLQFHPSPPHIKEAKNGTLVDSYFYLNFFDHFYRCFGIFVHFWQRFLFPSHLSFFEPTKSPLFGYNQMLFLFLQKPYTIFSRYFMFFQYLLQYKICIDSFFPGMKPICMSSIFIIFFRHFSDILPITFMPNSKSLTLIFHIILHLLFLWHSFKLASSHFFSNFQASLFLEVNC